MASASIFLILTCAVILIQSATSSNVNSNSNSNVFQRRNYNGNVNNNILGGSSKIPSFIDDEIDASDNTKSMLDEIHQKLLSDGNVDAANAAVGAAQATIEIIKSLANDMSESSAVAVASAVGNILADRSLSVLGPRSNRRNANYNSNINTNIVGSDRLRPVDDPKFNKGNDRSSSFDMGKLENNLGSLLGFSRPNKVETSGSSYDVSREMGFTAFGYGSGLAGPRNIFHDDEEDDDEKLATSPKSEEKEENDENVTTTDKIIGSRRVNSNVNNNRIKSSRRNINSNSNTNVFRRNINSNLNTNVNKYRRSNVNSNINSNIISHGHRHHRD